MAEVLIRKGTHTLTVSSEGGGAPIADLDARLRDRLTYCHRTTSYNWRGSNISTADRPLYVVEPSGALCCGNGCAEAIVLECLAAGHTPLLYDWPDEPRFCQDWDSVRQRFQFRPGQLEAVQQLAARTHGTLVAPPGWGKTHVFKILGALFPNARIHYIVDSLNVLRRIHNDLLDVDPGAGLVCGGSRRFGRLTAISADSLNKADPTDRKGYRGADIVVGDEVHRLVAGSYLSPLARYGRCRMYGFTATYDTRFDGAHSMLESLFGPIVYHVTYPEAVAQGVVVPIHVAWHDVPVGPNLSGIQGVLRERSGVWRNESRNKVIAEAVAAIPRSDQIMILVSTFDHAVRLKQLLGKSAKLFYTNVKRVDWETAVDNDMFDPFDEPFLTPRHRAERLEAFSGRQLMRLITTPALAYGVDFEQLEVVARADAQYSATAAFQGPGRVSRINTKGDKPYGLVLDFADRYDGAMLGRSRHRRSCYRSYGWSEEGWPSQQRWRVGP
jgi:hypothetical protein